MALAQACAMTPAPPALAAHVAAVLAQATAALGDRTGGARMRERARVSLAAVAAGADAERDEVARLLMPAGRSAWPPRR